MHKKPNIDETNKQMPAMTVIGFRLKICGNVMGFKPILNKNAIKYLCRPLLYLSKPGHGGSCFDSKYPSSYQQHVQEIETQAKSALIE